MQGPGRHEVDGMSTQNGPGSDVCRKCGEAADQRWSDCEVKGHETVCDECVNSGRLFSGRKATVRSLCKPESRKEVAQPEFIGSCTELDNERCNSRFVHRKGMRVFVHRKGMQVDKTQCIRSRDDTEVNRPGHTQRESTVEHEAQMGRLCTVRFACGDFVPTIVHCSNVGGGALVLRPCNILPQCTRTAPACVYVRMHASHVCLHVFICVIHVNVTDQSEWPLPRWLKTQFCKFLV